MEISEEYIEQQLLKDSYWLEAHGSELDMLRNAINMFLRADNKKSLFELCSFFEDGTLIESFKAVPDMAYCIIGITIMMKEFNMGYEEELFFKGVYSIDGAIEKINRYKFILLNIEFNLDRESSMKLLVNELISKKISPAALLYLIKCSSVDSQYILDEVMAFINDEGYTGLNNDILESYNVIFK